MLQKKENMLCTTGRIFITMDKKNGNKGSLEKLNQF